MALLAGNESEVLMLKRILGDQRSGDTTGDTLFLRLYDNNITPVEGDTWLTYSESDGTGYASVAIPGDTSGGPGWTYATGGGDTVSATYAQQTFTYTGGDTIYGYYVSTRDGETGDTVVLWSERFSDGPYTIPGGGGTIKVTPKVQLD
tara:strand:+ start:1324 stop:1767 length:444 start_codon:yes stop_codon:yes gene_type:complete